MKHLLALLLLCCVLRAEPPRPLIRALPNGVTFEDIIKTVQHQSALGAELQRALDSANRRLDASQSSLAEATTDLDASKFEIKALQGKVDALGEYAAQEHEAKLAALAKVKLAEAQTEIESGLKFKWQVYFGSLAGLAVLYFALRGWLKAQFPGVSSVPVIGWFL